MPRRINVNERKWTEPRLYPATPTAADMSYHWRVWFRYYDESSDKWIQIIRSTTINNYTVFSERLAEAQALIAALKYRLQEEGWNPITNECHPPEDRYLTVDGQLEALKDMGFNQAIDFAYQKKLADWSARTAQCYHNAIKHIKLAAKRKGLADKKICDFQLPHYKIILEEIKDHRKLSAIGFNKYRDHLSSLVSELIQWQVVVMNLVFHVKSKEVLKKVAHRPPTTDQRDIIMNRIRSTDRNYFRFLCVLYGCAMRPVEILRLKIKHLHKQEQYFRLRAEDGKTKMERDIPIPNWVMDLLAELNLHNLDPEYYIFSANNRHSTFLPGPVMMFRQTPTTTWRRIVKAPVDKGGLGLDITQYSLKKLSGDDMVRLQMRMGADKLLDLPKAMMGHTSTRMTEVYVTEHKEVMKQLVKDHMPEL